VQGRDFYLSKLAVIPDRRRTGAGAMVLERYLERGRGSGFCRFRLDVSSDNVPAIRLYERAGFEVVHTATTPKEQISYLGMVREDDASG
jgi:ribosomal protein S18 acetylase RimI-like enzyme